MLKSMVSLDRGEEKAIPHQLWFNYKVLDLMNVVLFYFVIISDVTNEFLPGDNKDLLN